MISVHTSKHQAGFSTLMLVLVLALLLELMLFSMFLVSKVSAERSTATVDRQEAYLAAEGVMADTLGLLQTGNWPKVLPYVEVVENKSDRQVTREVVFQPQYREYQIEVRAVVDDAQKILKGSFRSDVPSLSQQRKDVVLILDVSDSMTGHLDKLKSSAQEFLKSDFWTKDDRVSLISFSHTAVVRRQYTSDRNSVALSIEQLQISGGTNTAHALQQAGTLLVAARPEASKVVILFTDGVPTYVRDSKGQVTQCRDGCYTPSSTNVYQPENAGNFCTNEAVKAADSVHFSSEILVFGVYFSRNNGGECRDPARVEQLAKSTLQRIVGDSSRYYQIADLSQLEVVFDQFSRVSSDQEKYSYRYWEERER